MIAELIPTVAPRIHQEAPADGTEKVLSVWTISASPEGNMSKTCLEDELGGTVRARQRSYRKPAPARILSSDISKQFERKLTFAKWLSDRIASFGGSWRFIILFGRRPCILDHFERGPALERGFDPYPFILLNLILSCLAAMQAPIIMMSQNRAELRDRLRSENDYKINLKAELEIRHLHEKIDHLLRRQYNRLFEIQQIQIELLEEIGRKNKD